MTRSNFESVIVKDLQKRKVKFKYEPFSLPYTVVRKYTPDIILLDNGIIVEMKGRFVSSDRAKMIKIKQTYPNLDFRFVFMYNNKLSKSSKTTYVDWAVKHGFPCCVGKSVPLEWVKEKPKKDGIEAFNFFNIPKRRLSTLERGV